MPHLFHDSAWQAQMTAIALAPDDCDAHRLAVADLLAASGETVRAAYIRASVASSAGEGHAEGTPFVPGGGWVPQGELLCYWDRGFILQVHGPLAVVRAELRRLLLREPLYQSPDGPLCVSVSDHSPACADETWTWGHLAPDPDETFADLPGPLLPAELFDLLPWPPIFHSRGAAEAALSVALLSEAHDALSLPWLSHNAAAATYTGE